MKFLTTLICRPVEGKHREKDDAASKVTQLRETVYQLSESKDPPTVHWGVHGCGQIFGFDGFLANSENLCTSYD